jgi:hypothetical protein
VKAAERTVSWISASVSASTEAVASSRMSTYVWGGDVQGD